MWETLNLTVKLNVLASTSTIMIELLADDEGLIKLIRDGATSAQCYTYINAAY